MLNQLKYFLEIVDTGSFSEAAERQHISQSAISQQMKALEADLGVKLFERKGRKCLVTAAGDYFYKKGQMLVKSYEEMRKETIRIAKKDGAELKIGYLCGYGGWELQKAVAEFSQKYPKVSVQIISGSHEDLYDGLRFGQIDIAFSDKRRAFSDAYVNLVLTRGISYVELAAYNELSGLEKVTAEELKDIFCILISPYNQRDTESIYYREYIGFQGDFIFVENREEARLQVLGNKGFLPSEKTGESDANEKITKKIPLYTWRKSSMADILLILEKG